MNIRIANRVVAYSFHSGNFVLGLTSPTIVRGLRINAL